LNYAEKSLWFKALGDPTRLKIVDMISCGELCACVILEEFDIAQPSLSHHMKILCDCGLVNGRKQGKWIYYSLNAKAIQGFIALLMEVTSCNENCICNEINCEGDCDK